MRKSQEYYQMKLQWLSMSQIQEKNFSEYRERKCQIEKDVKRTDRTQEYFAGDENPNLGKTKLKIDKTQNKFYNLAQNVCHIYFEFCQIHSAIR